MRRNAYISNGSGGLWEHDTSTITRLPTDAISHTAVARYSDSRLCAHVLDEKEKGYWKNLMWFIGPMDAVFQYWSSYSADLSSKSFQAHAEINNTLVRVQIYSNSDEEKINRLRTYVYGSPRFCTVG